VYKTQTMSKMPATNSLIQPMSMEPFDHYVARFSIHKGMIALFNDDKQRRDVAIEIFEDRWEQALVTVRKLDGERFFID
jgi:hypothetical protein